MHSKLEAFRSLQKNWDSYGASPISEKALENADLCLKCFAAIQAVEPFIAPTSKGGVQLEWHRNGYDFELEVSPDGTTEIYADTSTWVK